MKKLSALCLCFILMFSVLPVASAAPANGAYFRLEVGYEGDYYFVEPGSEITLYSSLENVSAEDAAAFKPAFKFTKENNDSEEATGFKWQDLEGDKFVPEEEGVYLFAAEGVLPSKGKSISSIDAGIPAVLVIDTSKKTVVTTAEELVAAVNSEVHYISVQGNIDLVDSELHVGQRAIFEIARGYTINLKNSHLHFGIGQWKLGSTVLIDGNISVDGTSSLNTGNFPVDMFVSGRISGFDVKTLKQVQYVGCNVSPFEEFEGEYIENKNTGIKTTIENMSNATVLNIIPMGTTDQLYKPLASMDRGEVIMAFESNITDYDGEYTLKIPLDAKYKGKKIGVYIFDKTVSGYAEPTRQKIKYNGEALEITVDKNDVVMLKAPASIFSSPLFLPVSIGVAALAIMLLSFLAPAIFKKKKETENE